MNIPDPRPEVDARHARGVVIGDHAVQNTTFHLQSATPVVWPVRVGVVPPLAACLQDRATEFDLLDAGQTVVVTQVLSGLGGVGKTQLAAGLAEQVWRDRLVDLLVWVPAGSRASIVSGFTQAAQAVGAGGGPTGETAADRFLTWLAATRRRWLVVLDDLAEPSDLSGLWPPVTATGSTVVTTRRHDAALEGTGRRVVPVGLFTRTEAAAYVRQRFAGRPALADDVDGFAADLGWLPLALAQATAYMLDLDVACGEYRKRVADRRRRLSDVLPEAPALPDGHQATVDATWSLSIDRADLLRPIGLAHPVLQFAALLDPNGIPDLVLTAPASLAWLSRTIGGQAVDADDVRDALGALQRFSLVTRDQDRPLRMLRVHALVQRATREQTPPEILDQAARAAADALKAVWPDVERDAKLGQALRANTTTLSTMHSSPLWTTDNGGHPVLFRCGKSLGDSGQVTAAIEYFDELNTIATAQLGPDHRDTLSTRSSLAYFRGAAGDPAGAVTAFEVLLADRLRVLGPDHRDTLAARSNLARWRGEAGDPAGAVTAFEVLLTDRLRVLGPDHRDTLAARSQLAGWRGVTGDPVGAVAALEALLTDYLRILGPDHRETLTVRSQLAGQRGEAGDPAGAAAALEALLTDCLRVLGPDHPDTLTARSQAAQWRGEAGNPAGAATAFEALLTDYLRVLGPDHRDTLTARSQLARWRGEAGDPASAATAFEALLADYLRVLGRDHPDTLIARNNLAYFRGAAGDPAGAATAFEALLTDRLRVLGPNHPDTLAARSQLARWRGDAGDPAGAATAFEALLTDYQWVLGSDHPDTLTARSNLAYWRGVTGDPTGAAATLEVLLTDYQWVLGPDHPDTLIARDNLAYWHRRISAIRAAEGD